MARKKYKTKKKLFLPSQALVDAYQRVLAQHGLTYAGTKHKAATACDHVVVHAPSMPDGFVEIPGWEGLYAVNKDGVVWSIARPITVYHMRRKRLPKVGQALAPKQHKSGLMVKLTRAVGDYGDGYTNENYYVSNLMARTFLVNPIPSDQVVGFVNDDRYDCRLINITLVAAGAKHANRKHSAIERKE